jgi:hypothetical protein
MAKDIELKKEEEKIDVSKVPFKVSDKVRREGYQVLGEARAIRITSIDHDGKDNFEKGSLYVGTLSPKTRAYEWELKGNSFTMTGLTEFEVKMFGLAGAIVVPKNLENLLRKNF